VLILIVDTETTGIGDRSEAIELAATLYQVESDRKLIGAIASASTLLPIEGKNDAGEINGISDKLSYDSRSIFPPVVNAISSLVENADFAVAFNAEFDAPYWEKIVGGLPWICAMKDFDWGYPKKHFTLIELAIWLGIGVGCAHRAGDDVRLLVECFNRIDRLAERFDRAVVRSNSPLCELVALVSYGNRELAKNAGFGWDSNRKLWVKQVRECDLDLSVYEHLTFNVELMGEKL
jgi:DNA polymerase-3 subunit epsilon